MTRKAYLLSVDYEGSIRAARLKFFDPERQEIFFVVDWTGHKPYLLTDAPPEKVGEILGQNLMSRVHSITKIHKFDVLEDKEVLLTKIEAKDPLAIGGSGHNIRETLRSEGYRVWEANIRYYNCYIYDTGLEPGALYEIGDSNKVEPSWKFESEDQRIIKLLSNEKEEIEFAKRLVPLLRQPAPKLKVLALDIEVASPRGMIARSKDAKWPIISVSLCGNDGLKQVHILKRGRVPQIKKTKLGADIIVHEHEEELIREVLRIVGSYPLILTFNGDDFDLPYLSERAKGLGIRGNIIRREKDKVTVETGVHIDLYKLFRNASIRVYIFKNAYLGSTLDEIAEALLNERKIEVDKSNIPELPPEQLAEYSFQDAYLTLKLGTIDNNSLIRLLFVFSRISKLTLEDVARQGISRWISNMIFYEYRRRGWLIPNPEEIQEVRGKETYSKATIEGKKYKGALVLEPVPGPHFNVAVLDFASMYPSIIGTWRISFETINCPHEDCKTNKPVEELPHWVCKKGLGLIPDLIKTIRDLRVKWYKKIEKDPTRSPAERDWYGAVQRGLKVLLNASYGVFGYENFPLYSPPTAEMITAIGRKAILSSIEEAKALGLRVIYGDTDSLFIKNAPQEKIEELCRRIRDKLGIELELDKVYRYVILSRLKKNYLGILEDGSVEIKGLLGKKRNIPSFVRKAFEDVISILKDVRNEEDLENAKKRIVDVIKGWCQKLERGEFSLEEVAFEVMLTKPTDGYVKTTPQHVKAAIMIEKRKGIRIPPGAVVSFVKTKDKNGVKPVEFAKKEDLDLDKYLEIMETTFGQLLGALGTSFREVISGVKRQTLLDYF